MFELLETDTAPGIIDHKSFLDKHAD